MNGLRLTVIGVVVSLAASAASAGDVITPAKSLPQTSPWDLIALSKAPEVTWIDANGPVRSLTYRGLAFKGQPTRVFALYATPGSLAGDPNLDHNLPAVVLVHGGGGRAWKDWVTLWAKRGYAAISMDLAGVDGNNRRMSDGGPGQDGYRKYRDIDLPVADQWPFHAVANVILAHSLVRGLREVDANCTAVSGSSWGGYVTCIVAGLDNRFKAAAPVYGCGFLADNSVWKDMGLFAEFKPEQFKKWTTLWDPSMYIGAAAMPVFFVDTPIDFAYHIDSLAKTYKLVQSPRNIRLDLALQHGDPQAMSVREIGMFFDQYLRAGKALPVISTPVASGSEVSAKVSAATKLTGGELLYTSDTVGNKDRKWSRISAKVAEGTIVAEGLPADALVWYLTVTDDRKAMVSSEPVFSSKFNPTSQPASAPTAK